MKKHKALRKARTRRQAAYCSIRRALGICLLLLLVSSPAMTAENAGDKLASGVGETATGWVEAPKQIAETSEESNIIEGVTVGAVKGTGEAVMKTTEGAVKAATFFAPPYGESEQKQEDQPKQE